MSIASTPESAVNSKSLDIDQQNSFDIEPKARGRLRMLGTAMLRAIPDEARGLRDTFRQTREDMQEVRRIVAEDLEQGHPERVTRLDVIKYYAWRLGSTFGWQLSDDMYTLPGFIAAQDRFGTLAAYVGTNIFSTVLGTATGVGERKAQEWKAEAQGLEVEEYDGTMTEKMLDASVNAAAFNVLTTASQPRAEGDPVQIMSMKDIIKMSAAYGTLNTAFYALATQMPGLNSWQAFIAALGGMYFVKGTIRGCRELNAEQAEELNKPVFMHGMEIHT